MFEGFGDLYQEVIMDHNKNPRNFRAMDDADRMVAGQNPLCGDEVQVYVRLEDDRIADVSFQGHGCAISKSSASAMTEAVQGRSTAEALELFDAMQGMLVQGRSVDPQSLGTLAVFSGVGAFPARVKCAILAWHALKGALKGDAQVISTE